MLEVASPAVIRSLMHRYGIATRKSLGQNFLIDTNIINKIVDAAELSPTDLVVEIGPGMGALTSKAAARAGKVLAVEVDRGLIPVLAETLKGSGDVEVIQADALKVDFDHLALEKSGGQFGPGARAYKLLGNLPYYITSPLLMHLLMGRFNISLMIIMIQQEVAERLAALPGSRTYGSLSVAAQYFTEVKVLFKVPRTVFYPSPGVDSTVLRLTVRPSPAVAVRDEIVFFQVVRAAFGQRRKTLINSLANSGFNIDREAWLRALRQAEIDPARRGETLSLIEFAAITDNLMETNTF